MGKRTGKEYIALIDSDVANLASVYKALRKVGVNIIVTSDPGEIEEARGIVFPGVGSFAYAMDSLRRMKLDVLLKNNISAGKPFLGICLGLQLLFTSSEEGHAPGTFSVKGLNVIPGEVKHFPPGLPAPHVGWNRAYLCQPGHPLFAGLPDGPYFYFTHSYYVEPRDAKVKLSVTPYGQQFVSAVAQKNLMGVQFHPEKSGAEGLRLLGNFGRIVFGPSIAYS